MGRNYFGDINGKFVFAVQSSDCADRFGVSGQPPDTIYYHYGEDDLEALELELKPIEDEVFEDYKTPVITYFDLYGADPPISLKEYLEKGGLETMSSFQWEEYYDYHLGKEILECIKLHGCCSFSAEI